MEYYPTNYRLETFKEYQRQSQKLNILAHITNSDQFLKELTYTKYAV
jgi:hypothetical protein